MDSKTMGKINKYKEKRILLEEETRIICLKIDRLKKKLIVGK